MTKLLSVSARPFPAGRDLSAASALQAAAVDFVRLLALDRLPSPPARLACHWQRDAGGRLTCAWEADPSACSWRSL